MKIKDKQAPQDEKLKAANSLREDLVRCVMDKNLDELTVMYKDKQDSIIIGYEPVAVSKFVTKFRQAYPAPEKLKVENVDVFDNAKKIANYTEYDDGSNLLFDPLNIHHTDAFEEVMIGLIDGEYADIPGVDLDVVDKGDNESFQVTIGGVAVAYFRAVGDEYEAQYMAKNQQFTTVVTENKQLLGLLQSIMNDNY